VKDRPGEFRGASKMAGFLEAYGAGDERRIRLIKRSVIAVAIALVAGITLYVIFKNYSEKRAVKQFLAEVNAGEFQQAYRTWGCSDAHPCPGYSYQKFLEDWGPKSNRNNWKISNVDGCQTGVVVTVSARGSEPEALWVQRSDKSLSFSPWPECQERKWRFRQFFQRVFGG
jgi:hypothetical protein